MPIFELLFGFRRDDPEVTIRKLQDLFIQESKKDQLKSSKCTGEKYLAKIKRGLSEGDYPTNCWLDSLCNRQGVEALLNSIMKLEVEGKRSASSILLCLLQCKAKEGQVVNLFKANSDFICILMDGYAKGPQVAVCCGIVLRECMNLRDLRSIILTKENVVALLKCMSSDAFDAASDAYETLRV